MDRLVSWGRLAVVGALSACSSPAAESKASCREAVTVRVCEDAGAHLRGLDVSTYQGAVDWAQVKAAGVTFAFARISDGTANPDRDFVANWQGMQQNGIVRGAYQYFRAGVDPSTQANLVAASLQKAGGLHAGDLPVVMDIETADGQSESVVEAKMRTWLAAVEAVTARTPMIYTSAGTYPVTTAAFAAYPLWIANYAAACPALPTGWSQWRFWQTSSTGMVSGIGGAVDLDEYPGALVDLVRLAGSTTSDSGGSPSPVGDGGRAPDVAKTWDDGGGTGATDSSGHRPVDATAGPDSGAAMGQAGYRTTAADASPGPCVR